MQRKRDFARIVDKRPPTPAEFEQLKESTQKDFRNIAEYTFERQKDPAIGTEQIAARLGVTHNWLEMLIKSGELPPPPSPRTAGDGYHKVCERAWRNLTPARRRGLQARSEKEPS